MFIYLDYCCNVFYTKYELMMSNKKHLKKGIILIAVIITATLSYLVINTLDRKQDISENLKNLPTLKLKDLDNNIFKIEDIEGLKVLVYINTECGYCEDQFNELSLLKEKVNNLSIIAISSQDINILKKYYQNSSFFKSNSNFLTYDYTYQISTDFDIESTPHLLIYNENNHLISQNKGFIKADKLEEKIKKLIK